MKPSDFHKTLEVSLAFTLLASLTAALTFGCEETHNRQRELMDKQFEAGRNSMRLEVERKLGLEHPNSLDDAIEEFAATTQGLKVVKEAELQTCEQRRLALAKFKQLTHTLMQTGSLSCIPGPHNTTLRPTRLVVKCQHPNCAKESYLEDWTNLSLTELPDDVFGWTVPQATRDAYYSYTCPHCRLTLDGYSNKSVPRYRNPWLPTPPMIVPDDPRRVPRPILTRREWSLLRNYDEKGVELFDPKTGYFSPGVLE